MNTCMNCIHWNPKATDANMLRHGFARCDKKALPGHTVSAKARVCESFSEIDTKKATAREKWLAERKAI